MSSHLDRLPPDLFEQYFVRRHLDALPAAQQLALVFVSKRFAAACGRWCAALQAYRNTAPAHRQREQTNAACSAIRSLGGAVGLVRWLVERLRFKPDGSWCEAAAEGMHLIALRIARADLVFMLQRAASSCLRGFARPRCGALGIRPMFAAPQLGPVIGRCWSGRLRATPNWMKSSKG